jgi:4a-hydroxytetrahydrobiopterin dehydratase
MPDQDDTLSAKRCKPCEGETSPIEGEELRRLAAQVPDWTVTGGEGSGGGARRLERQFKFPDFRGALAFVNRVGEVAEEEGHHPDIELGWGRVKVILWTHSIGGLSENDFILAAKADQALAAP